MKRDKTDSLLLVGTILTAVASALLASARERRNTEKAVKKNLLEMGKDNEEE